ncbi:hypothetical protein K474DRAFT_1686787 [Panus rudis PR-1116 ss-1]|nr:hypothetical protein K474DRAFT_1686787 [Panus rudis PR-1116 ss-1]
MPRNHNAAPSTLRNRNRVTNKTRLKVIKESIDADPIVLDEDEEKARVVSTAGVDAEDANEEHLQAVLSAAAHRHQNNARATRTAEKESAQPQAYIPTPDSTGIVQDYETLYPPGRWTDPVNYLKSSDTVEESISFALAGGFIYYMDERDKEWLDKNNEEARGEGTSAQGAISGTSTRSGRSSKAKGKDPEVSQPIAMSEDEFELVMAIFEKATHEQAPLLHHGFGQGETLPPFSDFSNIFSSPLSPDLFALYEVPSWVASLGDKLLRNAKAIYPYWRERRIERAGHPIMPSVNLDESDTLNESYICFRRRELKAVRKTRAQQATYSDKMTRLKAELEKANELAVLVHTREQLKRESAAHGQVVWIERFMLADHKRKFPSLGTKEDEELLQDKERPPKRPKPEQRLPLKIRPTTNGEPTHSQDPIMHPKARFQQIQKKIEEEMSERRAKDHHWEDAIDNPYQPTPTSYQSRLWKAYASSSSSRDGPSTPPSPPRHRAVRLRYGRGGRMLVDRRSFAPPPVSLGFDSEDDDEARERTRRLLERWRFDDDDVPAAGPGGPEEEDRILVDDHSVSYLPAVMSLLSEQDHMTVATDSTITVTLPDGKQTQVVPLRWNSVPVGVRRDFPAQLRPNPSASSSASGMQIRHPNGTSMSLPSVGGGAAVSMPAHLKSMPPPPLVPTPRISSNSRANMPSAISPPLLPPTTSQSPPREATVNGAHEMPNGVVKTEQDAQPTIPSNMNGVEQSVADASSAVPPHSSPVTVPSSPARPKSQNQQHPTQVPAYQNGYHLALGGYTTPVPNNSAYLARGAVLTPQQMQSLKAYAITPLQDNNVQNHANMPMRAPNYLQMTNDPRYSAQIQAARQAQQWQALNTGQMRTPAMHVMESNASDASAQMSPIPGGQPRTPSSTGSRGVSMSRGVPSPAIQHAMSPGQGRASPANSTRLPQHSPPPPIHLSPSMVTTQAQSSPTKPPHPPLPSPSLQTRQVVGQSGAGY